jgi:Toprim-like
MIAGMMKKLWDDPAVVPDTGEEPAAAFAAALEADHPRCAEYLHRRRIPLKVALAAEIRFSPSFTRRPAVLAAMRHHDGNLRAITARYLSTTRDQEKILTVGHAGGVFAVLEGLRADPLLLVEGVFDALSVAACGYSAVATIGRYVDWMPDFAAGRTVLFGFDGNKVGDHAARYYKDRMPESTCRRLRPPARCKDWSSALSKRGQSTLRKWLADGHAAAAVRTVEPCAS